MKAMESVKIGGTTGAFPLLFLHGGGLNRNMWLPQIEMLGGSYSVIAADLPGHGAMRGCGFTLDAAVGIVSGLIERHAGGQAVLVGSSLGGYVAIAHAAAHPEQVAGLVLSGCAAEYRHLLGFAAWAGTFALCFVGNRYLVKRQRQMLLRVATPEVVAAMTEAGLSPAGGRTGLMELIGKKFKALLGTYPGPVLMLNGDRDWLNRRAESSFVKSGGVELGWIPGAGHLCSLEKPQLFSEAVGAFVAKIAGDGSRV